MALRPADDLILAGLAWGCKRRVDGTTGLQLDLPVYVGNVFFIEELTGLRTQFHNYKVMYHCPII
ncbi:MAG: hypothetical protein WCC12_14055, partial [Anaerolineales bacterium]